MTRARAGSQDTRQVTCLQSQSDSNALASRTRDSSPPGQKALPAPPAPTWRASAGLQPTAISQSWLVTLWGGGPLN